MLIEKEALIGCIHFWRCWYDVMLHLVGGIREVACVHSCEEVWSGIRICVSGSKALQVGELNRCEWVRDTHLMVPSRWSCRNWIADRYRWHYSITSHYSSGSLRHRTSDCYALSLRPSFSLSAHLYDWRNWPGRTLWKLELAVRATCYSWVRWSDLDDLTNDGKC